MTTSYDIAAGSKLAWVTTARWERLHTLKVFYLGTEPDTFWDFIAEDGGARLRTAMCGTEILVQLPGFFSRMGLPRCAYCCDKVGVPRGFGAPANHKNDPYLSNPDYERGQVLANAHKRAYGACRHMTEGVHGGHHRAPDADSARGCPGARRDAQPRLHRRP